MNEPSAVGRGRTLVVVSAATLLALMNYNSTFSTLALLAKDLDAGAAAQTWLLTALSLGAAVLLLAVGRLADLYGRGRVLRCGILVLAASSLVAAVAQSALVFIVTRFVQGGATAAVLAAGLALVAAAQPDDQGRARATGIWSSMLALGIAAGPVVSAALAQLIHWRAWYVLAAVAALVIAVGTCGLDSGRGDSSHRFDVAGALALSLGTAVFLAALTLSRGGWLQPVVLIGLILAAILLGAFVVVELRAADPLIDLRLFSRHDFAAATVGALIMGVACVGLMSYMPTLVEHVAGQSPTAAGATLTVWAGTQFFTSLQARKIRLRPRNLLGLGLVIAGVGTLVLIGLSGWMQLIPGLVIAGIGSGLGNAALANLAVSSVPQKHAAMGAGANNTARYIGASFGVAIVITIANTPADLRDGANHALIACAVISVLGAAAVVLGGSKAPMSSRTTEKARL